MYNLLMLINTTLDNKKNFTSIRRSYTYVCAVLYSIYTVQYCILKIIILSMVHYIDLRSVFVYRSLKLISCYISLYQVFQGL
ncbi:hypothetical protein Hamer_G022370 [Homarus americanus]|uniref:Uncharacterized protein n=1 Tax=Homarus americanus TaxID=6706 RepID=A0A8J5JD79_HOMAM|nr:hypothetical protein Hamer_G022370 [Homarus americanus]